MGCLSELDSIVLKSDCFEYTPLLEMKRLIKVQRIKKKWNVDIPAWYCQLLTSVITITISKTTSVALRQSACKKMATR